VGEVPAASVGIANPAKLHPTNGSSKAIPAPAVTVNMNPTKMTPATMSGVAMKPVQMSPGVRFEGVGSHGSVHVGSVGVGSTPLKPLTIKGVAVHPVSTAKVDVTPVDIKPVDFGSVHIGEVGFSGESVAGTRRTVRLRSAWVPPVEGTSGPGLLVAGGSAVGCDPEHPVLVLPTREENDGPGSKIYDVDPGLEIKLVTAREDDGVASAQLTIVEQRPVDGHTSRAFHLRPRAPEGADGAANYYVPQGNEIRLSASSNALVHLNVCQKAPRTAELALGDADEFARDFALSGH
jgi:hypothetical protein